MSTRRRVRIAAVAILVLDAVLWLLAYAAHGGDGLGPWRAFFAVVAVGLAALGWFVPGPTGLALVVLGILGAMAAFAIVIVEDVGGAAIALILLPTAACPIVAGALFIVCANSGPRDRW